MKKRFCELKKQLEFQGFRFRFQRETQKHLEELKKITQIRRMQEDTLKLQQEFKGINKGKMSCSYS